MAKSEPIHDGKGWQDIPTSIEAGIPDAESYKMPRNCSGTAADVPGGLALAYYTEVLHKVSETFRMERVCAQDVADR